MFFFILKCKTETEQWPVGETYLNDSFYLENTMIAEYGSKQHFPLSS